MSGELRNLGWELRHKPEWKIGSSVRSTAERKYRQLAKQEHELIDYNLKHFRDQWHNQLPDEIRKQYPGIGNYPGKVHGKVQKQDQT